MAMGVARTFDATVNNIFTSAFIIAVTTFVLCVFALVLGKKAGERLGERAEIVGGIVLILIGLKNLLF